MRAQGALKVYVYLVRPFLAKYHTHLESLVEGDMFAGAHALLQECLKGWARHLLLPKGRSTQLLACGRRATSEQEPSAVLDSSMRLLALLQKQNGPGLISTCVCM